MPRVCRPLGDAMNDWFEAEHHIERAHEHYENGRWDEAESALREALALNPYRSEWHFNLGLTLEAAGRYADAARAFQDCYALESDDPQVLYLIGTNYLRAGQARPALEWLDRAHKADPKNMGTLVRKIEAHTLLGEHEQAEVVFYLSQQVDPTHAEALAAMADSLLSRRLIDKAVWCLREAATNDPSLPGIHSKLAHAYAATGRLERARQLYLRELRTDPGDIDTLLDLGMLLSSMNRAQEASEKFRRVLELEPDNADAHFQLAELERLQNNWSAAAEQYEVVLRLDDAYPMARLRLAMLLLDSPQDNLREHCLLRVRDLLDAELSDVQQQMRAPKSSHPEVQADRSLSGLTLAEPVPSEHVHELAKALLEAKRPDDARRLLRLALDQRAASPDIETLHLFGVSCFALNTHQDRLAGIDACREVLRLDPRFLPAIHNLGVAYAQMRRWSRARYWTRQGLRVEPEDAALRRLRFKLRLCLVIEAFDALKFVARALNPFRPSRHGWAHD